MHNSSTHAKQRRRARADVVLTKGFFALFAKTTSLSFFPHTTTEDCSLCAHPATTIVLSIMLLSRAISSASRTAALNLVKAPPSSASALPFLAALTVSLSACSIHSTSGDIARADGGEPALSGKEFR